MELWTEYEGRTIDGAYPLNKLLQPEGRSAFFATSNGTGEQTVIRLIESHFDDDEILGRWRGIRGLDHPNLVRLKQFGSVVLDDTSLVYAVIEPVDANLAEIVRERKMTVEETRQLAASMIAALDALHSNGFVHEHVATHTVLAVGETIKLRSDCIREAPEGEDGQRLKQRDARDLSLVLLQALTQRSSLDEIDYALPAPFDAMIRNGIRGSWTVADLARALDEGAPSQPAAAPPSRPAPSVSQPQPVENSARAVRSNVVEMAPPVERVAPRRTSDLTVSEVRSKGRGLWVVAGVAAVLVLWLAWHFSHNQPSAQAADAVPSHTIMPASPLAAAPLPAASEALPVANQTPAATTRSPAAASGREQWRVVAFTYNRQGQAQEKAGAVAQKHPELHAEVFSPNGRAPYLVTIGGAMTRDEAFALAKRARHERVARDVYAQNYNSRG